MSLFGFADIKFNKVKGPTNGPLKALKGSDEFAMTTLRYPADVGNYDKGHYMVFFIREQKRSAYARNDNLNDEVINVKQLKGTENFQFENIGLPTNSGSNFLSDMLGKIGSSLGLTKSATGDALSLGVNNGSLSSTIPLIENKSFIKTTQLTKDAIALYMPDTLQFSFKQSYDQLTPGNELLGKLAAAGQSITRNMIAGEGGLFDKSYKSYKDAILGAVDAAKVAGIQAASRAGGRLLGSSGAGEIGAYLASGVVTNPLLELLYKSPNLRTFQFDFMFYPRDEREALEVQKILERFRFHQAPEFLGPKNAEQIGFLIPPSEFDIRFFYGGAQNPNIPAIGTCVLTDIDMNYAPNGWSAYEIPGESQPNLGRTGMPVAVQMSLTFQETTYLTKSDFKSASEKAGDSGPTIDGKPYSGVY